MTTFASFTCGHEAECDWIEADADCRFLFNDEGACGRSWADYLPPLGDELPACPSCGLPGLLVAVLAELPT